MADARRHRRSVKRALERARHRLARLIGAEKNRDAVTAKRKRKYRQARDRYGDRDVRTRRALRRYRLSRELGQKIDEAEAVIRQRAENKVKWLREHPLPPGDYDHDGL